MCCKASFDQVSSFQFAPKVGDAKKISFDYIKFLLTKSLNIQ